jgi:hypothetical protein
MRPILWLMAAALPLAAQPKLLVNARLDTRPASAGLEQSFRPLVTAQPQPAWIAYSVPSTRVNHRKRSGSTGETPRGQRLAIHA